MGKDSRVFFLYIFMRPKLGDDLVGLIPFSFIPFNKPSTQKGFDQLVAGFMHPYQILSILFGEVERFVITSNDTTIDLDMPLFQRRTLFFNCLLDAVTIR